MTKLTPYGYCECGCGNLAPLAKQSLTSKGHVRGEPLRFIHGHNAKKGYEEGWIAQTGPLETPCHIWTGRMNNRGAGQTRNEGVAYVVAWEKVHGPVPPFRHLHHRCENRACVNETHLDLLTPSQHRLAHSHISPQTAEAIAIAEGSQREIARRFGVSQGTVWRLKHGLRTYRDRSS